MLGQLPRDGLTVGVAGQYPPRSVAPSLLLLEIDGVGLQRLRIATAGCESGEHALDLVLTLSRIQKSKPLATHAADLNYLRGKSEDGSRWGTTAALSGASAPRLTARKVKRGRYQASSFTFLGGVPGSRSP